MHSFLLIDFFRNNNARKLSKTNFISTSRRDTLILNTRISSVLNTRLLHMTRRIAFSKTFRKLSKTDEKSIYLIENLLYNNYNFTLTIENEFYQLHKYLTICCDTSILKLIFTFANSSILLLFFVLSILRLL